MTILFRLVVTVDVTLVFVRVVEDRETKTDCSVRVTVVRGEAETKGHGITVDTKSYVEYKYGVEHLFLTQTSDPASQVDTG